MKHLAVVMTVYNRKEKTLACLAALFHQEKLGEEFDISVYLTDDGSMDGTAGAVRERYPEVNILTGSGDLYWNKGMHLAFGEALKGDHDFYLWMNDDTNLFQHALTSLLEISTKFQHKAIIAGSIKDPDTNQWSYGGVIKKEKIRPLKFTPVMPSNSPKPIDTMNGNCVLIPNAVAKILGNLDPAFTHGMGDRDYGLRARKHGINIYLAPGYYGYCKRNPTIEYSKSIKDYFKTKLSKKQLPFKEYAKFAKRHAGPFWPIYTISPYIREIINLTFKRRN